MNCIIKKKKEQLEIPYYQLEKVCKEIVRNYLKEPGLTKEESLKRKKDFFEFRKGYKTFSPYFDFVFTRLSYQLQNPFMISNTYLEFQEEEGKIYYYARPDGDHFNKWEKEELLHPLFMDGKEENIRREVIRKNLDNLCECFIDEEGMIVTLKDKLDSHSFWSRQWVHERVKQNYCFYQCYLNLLEDDSLLYFDQSKLMIQFCNMIQVALIGKENYLIRFHSDYLSQIQRDLIEYLKVCEIVSDSYCLDMKEVENRGVKK